MKSKGNNPTALEAKWRGIVADFAERSDWMQETFGMFCNNPSAFELDHFFGAQAKRKINLVSVKIGEFAIIPLPYELHNVRSAHPLNRTLSPSAFRKHIGVERGIFSHMIGEMKNNDIEIPFSDEIVTAIVGVK